MPLTSNLFKGDPLFEKCLVQDAAHVVPGATGDHVSKIHTALFVIDRVHVASADLSMRRYGPSTAAAVLTYKRKRNIVNRTYQTQPDNIVGKMTIASLDAEMFRVERTPQPPPDPRSFAWTTRRG